MTLKSHSEWDIIPFDTQPTEVAQKPSLFWKMGNELGNLFVFTKKRVTSKYREVTRGINQKLDEEYEHLRAEFEADLFAQTEAFEYELKVLRRRWIGIAIITAFIGFFIGMLTAFNLI
ncbi:hypothetical protein EV697_101491 [Bisgaardia hudsonensis]|uniref:Uncharacterized protein n=1 Tax=Bisgaardia hudsonensis TaxID=109472 RepID=A0A4V2SJD8_9PAST|nr:hypothetical protein [Bisgaardia hudsonensis]QLB12795.1 hypothetical protein A6A11_03830 [Bisgaardia hudsonensis]TCP14350.1 hypothetical protein EV697_101491 [Bisgaardia hudsonensis]